MKERPILFSGPMVRAIMEGRKTQTRRVVKPQPVFDGYWWSCGDYHCNREQEFRAGMPHFVKHSYGTIGDQLWVREAFCTDFKPLIYRASATSDTYGGEKIKYKPSIHMPRLASRITLEITGVRVERLQEISEKDVAAEGTPGMICGRYQCEYCNGNGSSLGVTCGDCKGTGNDALSYWMDLWQSINGPESWSANPWVWVIEFRRVQT